MARHIIPETKAPELGTKEAALRGCVDLIACICGKPEHVVRYWLDLYFQTRLAYAVEEEQRRRKEAGCWLTKWQGEVSRAEGEAPDPDRAAHTPDAQAEGTAESKIEDEPVAEGSVTPPTDPPSELTGFEPVTVTRRRQGAPKGNTRAADAMTFKRETAERLRRARQDGVTIAQIVGASNGRLADGTVLDMLSAKPVSIGMYRKLAEALDRIES